MQTVGLWKFKALFWIISYQILLGSTHNSSSYGHLWSVNVGTESPCDEGNGDTEEGEGSG